MDAMEFVVEKQLKSLLLDEDPTKIEFLHQKMMWNNWANGRQGMVMGAISGIDVALWDILGKVANLPVCKLDRKSTRLNSSHTDSPRMPSSA